MKNSIIQSLFAFFVTGSMLSCNSHDDFLSSQDQEVRIDFDSTRLIVVENSEQQILQLSFNRKTVKNGVLTLSISEAAQSRFITDPAISNGQIILNVNQNENSAILKIKPVNNSHPDGNLEFIVSISSTSAGFTIGDRKSVSVKLQDDDFVGPPQEVAARFDTRRALS